VILVEVAGSKTIYEAIGTWRQCKRWISQVSRSVILADQFAVAEKRIELNRLATIHDVQASPDDLEAAGFSRAGE
jgi:hypothetical protein